MVFRPGPIRSGNYAFRVGTAGSATLVLQTVLPALLLAEGESNLVLEGGTHNPMAPPVDFLEKAYLPLVNRLGPRVEVQLVRPGFYPAGGGKFTVRVQPAKQLGRLELLDRGADPSPPGPGHGGQPATAYRRAGVSHHRPGDRLG